MFAFLNVLICNIIASRFPLEQTPSDGSLLGEPLSDNPLPDEDEFLDESTVMNIFEPPIYSQTLDRNISLRKSKSS